MTTEIAPQFFPETPLYTVTFQAPFNSSRDVTFTKTGGGTDRYFDRRYARMRTCPKDAYINA